jgi:hypothetical protein
MAFSEPEETGGIRLNPRDIVNHLLLIWAIDYVAHSPTQFSRPDKPSDVIIVDAVDLDQVDENGQAGLVARKCWWRQAQLIQSLKPKVGGKDPMLVRMGRGGATMGRNAPYQLVSMTADAQCVSRATSWLMLNPGFTPSKPGVQLAVPQDLTDPWRNDDPADQPDWSTPEPTNLPPPRPVTPAEETVLERMARTTVQSQRPGQRDGSEGFPF